MTQEELQTALITHGWTDALLNGEYENKKYMIIPYSNCFLIQSKKDITFLRFKYSECELKILGETIYIEYDKIAPYVRIDLTCNCSKKSKP